MTQLDVSDLTKNFGSVVRGLNPAALDEETCQRLRRLFDERGALVFPALDIDFEGQDRLCRMLIGRDGASGKRQSDPFYVSNKEEGGFAPYGRLLFHADMMWHADPFQVLSLYAMDVQPGSAGTALTSSEKAAPSCFDYGPATSDQAGKPNPYSPELTVSGGIEYGFPALSGEFKPRLDYSYTAHQWQTIQELPGDYMAPRHLLNGTFSYTRGPWTVQLYGTNLLDQIYIAGATYGPSVFLGAPRQFGVRVARTF